ncbi:CDP-diacylglycerol--inositol 3-phosphatidyltransferase [Armadillidium vulgare]|nr:CDP-diacylglycerol--inositol 3-phosphatidyltransferase [Armadillidium vulgare]
MAENIFLFVPNLIGFGRIILLFAALYYMPENHLLASSFYILSGFLDAFDGHAARIFNQSTKFGAMLDMLTDRCGTMVLIAMLCTFYPKYTFLFQTSMIIDIACHWLHLHVTLLSGQTSHKAGEANVNPLLKIYYSSRPLLFILCAGNELFYSMLYLLHFTEGPALLFGFGVFRLLLWFCFPIAIVKSVLALMQGYYAAINLANIDVADRSGNKAK